MAEHDGRTEYIKSGMHRLRDAEELIQSPTLMPKEQGARLRHMRGAAYLAGYGVECLLKSFIIGRNPPHQRLSSVREVLTQYGQPIRDICSGAGHDLRYLLTLTGLEERMGDDMRLDIGLCFKWKPAWRYDPRPMNLEDSTTHVAACRRVVNWILSQS